MAWELNQLQHVRLVRPGTTHTGYSIHDRWDRIPLMVAACLSLAQLRAVAASKVFLDRNLASAWDTPEWGSRYVCSLRIAPASLLSLQLFLDLRQIQALGCDPQKPSSWPVSTTSTNALILHGAQVNHSARFWLSRFIRSKSREYRHLGTLKLIECNNLDFPWRERIRDDEIRDGPCQRAHGPLL